MFNIIKYCSDKKACENQIGYNKLKTGGNNPHISKAMRYSQLINNAKPKIGVAYNATHDSTTSLSSNISYTPPVIMG